MMQTYYRGEWITGSELEYEDGEPCPDDEEYFVEQDTLYDDEVVYVSLDRECHDIVHTLYKRKDGA